MSELSLKVKAKDMELVPTSGRELCEALNAALLTKGGVGHVAHTPFRKTPQNREKTLGYRQKTA